MNMSLTFLPRTRAITVAMLAFAFASADAASVGDTVVWRNSGTAGSGISNANGTEHNLQFCLPPMDGLPRGSQVKLTNISLGSRNTALGDTDPMFLSFVPSSGGYVDSHILNGTGNYSGDTISAYGTYVPRLSYSFDGVTVVVGETNKLETLQADQQHYMTPGFKCVQTSDTPGALVMSSVSGNGWYPVYEITAEVLSLGANPDISATISGDTSLSALSWSSQRRTDGTQWATINVTGNATLSLDAVTNFKMLTLKVAGGRTLTLTGSSALTATKIDISGKGTVAAATTSLSGAIVGSGKVVYTGALPSGVTFDYNWNGTLTLANCAITGPNFNNYGNVASAIKLSGVSGWIHTDHGEYVVPIILEDGSYDFALKLTNGNSPNNNLPNRCSTFRKISGDGSIVDGIAQDPDGKWAWPVVKIYDATGFAGNILLNRRANLIVCDETTTFPDSFFNMFNLGNYEYLKDGVLRIDGVRSPTLANGKTWSINVYSDSPDYNNLIVFETARDGLLAGGDLQVYVNGSPLDTSRYAVREGKGPMRGHIVIKEMVGFRLRLR